MHKLSWQPWLAYPDVQAIMAALASLSSTCNVTLSTVPSHHLISRDAEALGCEVFMQSLLSELYSIVDSEAIFLAYVCLPSNSVLKV